VSQGIAPAICYSTRTEHEKSQINSNSSTCDYNNVKRLLYSRFFVKDGEPNGDDVDSGF
jgi:hypothetical protein